MNVAALLARNDAITLDDSHGLRPGSQSKHGFIALFEFTQRIAARGKNPEGRLKLLFYC